MEIRELEKNLKTGKTVWEITADTTEVNQAMEKTYADVASQIQLPGFRKGKVPKKVLESKVGIDYFRDETRKVLIEKGIRLFSEKKIPHISEDVEMGEITEKGFSFNFIVYDVPALEKSDYFKISAEAERIDIQPELVDQTIENMRKRMAFSSTVEGRPAADGDDVSVDFEGFISGKKFPGGSDHNHVFKLGEGRMIRDLEQGIIGMNTGETKEIPAVFPEDYRVKKLAGAQAVFQVKLNEIKEEKLPALDDDFAKDLNYENLADMKEKVTQRFNQMKQDDRKNRVSTEVLKKVSDALGIEAPRMLVEDEIDRLVKEFEENVKKNYRDFRLETFLENQHQTIEKFRENYRAQAETNIKGHLVLQGIIRSENFSVSAGEIENRISDLAQSSGIALETMQKYFQSDSRKQSIEEEIKLEKAVSAVYDSADITEVEPAKTEEHDSECGCDSCAGQCDSENKQEE